jgi:signal transduction histidine kinase
VAELHDWSFLLGELSSTVLGAIGDGVSRWSRPDHPWVATASSALYPKRRVGSVTKVTGWRALRPTRIESVLAAVLLLLALAEALYSDEQPAPTALRLLAAIVPPVAVAFSRTSPACAATAVLVVEVISSLQSSESGTLGAGLAGLAIVFGVAAWSRQPWPWILALIAAGTIHDLRIIEFDTTDVVIDWVFVGFTVWIGRIVHRRTAQADALTTQLQLADASRETRTKEAVARERALIARELHDIVAHSVSLMVVQAGTARPIAQRVDRELADVLSTIEQAGREALTELRRVLHVLRSADQPDLQPLPDLSQLDSLVDGARSAGVDVRSSFALPVDVPAGIGLCAYRTVQEGLTNALRYANGSQVDVDVSGDKRTLHVRVHDHGGTTTARELGTGTGLIGLRERVLLCGGRLSAGPDGAGYLLEATLPMSDEGLPGQATYSSIDGGPP